MSLEYIFKFMILLVVIGVIITLVLNFKSDISNNMCSLLGTCDNQQAQGCDTEIRQGDFDSRGVAKWVKSCWSQHKNSRETCVCYSLQGSFSATKPAVEQAVTTEAGDHLAINTNFSQVHVVNVIYSLEQDKIVVNAGG